MKTLLTVFFIPFCFCCYSQLPDYYVFLVKGEVLISKPEVKPVLLKQHVFIYKDHLITLKKDAELTVSDKDQNFFVLRSPGVYKGSDLSKMKIDRIPGVTQSYLKLIWNELLNPNNDFTKFTNKNLTNVYGGVSRGDQCNNLIFPINGLKTSGDALHFIWHQTSPSSKYTFFIYDSEGKDASKLSVKDTQLTINKNQFAASKTGKYYWLVKSDDATCEDEVPIYFELMTKEDETKLISSLVPVTGNEDLQNKFQTIDALEKKGMIYAAADFYKNMMKEYPEDEALHKSYVLYLLKYGFNEEAMVAWNGLKK